MAEGVAPGMANTKNKLFFASLSMSYMGVIEK